MGDQDIEKLFYGFLKFSMLEVFANVDLKYNLVGNNSYQVSLAKWAEEEGSKCQLNAWSQKSEGESSLGYFHNVKEDKDKNGSIQLEVIHYKPSIHSRLWRKQHFCLIELT